MAYSSAEFKEHMNELSTDIIALRYKENDVGLDADEKAKLNEFEQERQDWFDLATPADRAEWAADYFGEACSAMYGDKTDEKLQELADTLRENPDMDVHDVLEALGQDFRTDTADQKNDTSADTPAQVQGIENSAIEASYRGAENSATTHEPHQTVEAQSSEEPQQSDYDKAKAAFEKVDGKLTYNNTFLCLDRLKLDIEAYKTGQDGHNGKPVSGGDIYTDVVRFLNSDGFVESFIEMAIRDYLDTKYPPHDGQDVATEQRHEADIDYGQEATNGRGDVAHEWESPSVTDDSGRFRDDGYIAKDNDNAGVTKEEVRQFGGTNPGFGRFWGADLTAETRFTPSDMSMTVRDCGKRSTDSAVIGGKEERLFIPPMRLVEIDNGAFKPSFYLIDPFGQTLASNVDIQTDIDKPHFKSLDISSGRGGAARVEAMAQSKGMSVESYKDSVIAKAKLDYVSRGLDFIARHEVYLKDNDVAGELRFQIDQAKSEFYFLKDQALQSGIDIHADRDSVSFSDTPKQELTADQERLYGYVKAAEEKVERMETRLDQIEKTSEMYTEAKALCADRNMTLDDKFYAVAYVERYGAGKMAERPICYDRDPQTREEIKNYLESKDYKFDPDRRDPDDIAKDNEAAKEARIESFTKYYHTYSGYPQNKVELSAFAALIERSGARSESGTVDWEKVKEQYDKEDLDPFMFDVRKDIYEAVEDFKERGAQQADIDGLIDKMAAAEDVDAHIKAEQELYGSLTDEEADQFLDGKPIEEIIADREKNVEVDADKTSNDEQQGVEQKDGQDTAQDDPQDVEKPEDTDDAPIIDDAERDAVDTQEDDKAGRDDHPESIDAEEAADGQAEDDSNHTSADEHPDDVEGHANDKADTLDHDDQPDEVESERQDVSQPDSASETDKVDLDDKPADVETPAQIDAMPDMAEGTIEVQAETADTSNDANATEMPEGIVDSTEDAKDLPDTVEPPAANDTAEDIAHDKDATSDNETATDHEAAEESDFKSDIPENMDVDASTENDTDIPDTDIEQDTDGHVGFEVADNTQPVDDIANNDEDGQAAQVESSEDSQTSIEKDYRNGDPVLAEEGEQEVETDQKPDFEPLPAYGYGDVWLVGNDIMNSEQYEHYKEGPMDMDAVLDKIEEYLSSEPGTMDFREDFLEPYKFNYSTQDLMTALASKFKDVQDDIESGKKDEDTTPIDRLLDCMSAIQDMAFDNFVGMFDDVAQSIKDIYNMTPSEGHDIMSRFLNEMSDIADPVLSPYEPATYESAAAMGELADRLDSFGNWAGLDVSEAIDLATQMDSAFDGFSDMLVEVGNAFSDTDVLHDVDVPESTDVDTGLQTGERTELEEAMMPDSNVESLGHLHDDQTDLDIPDAADVPEHEIDPIDTAVDKLEALGDMFSRLEDLTDQVKDMDIDELAQYATGG